MKCTTTLLFGLLAMGGCERVWFEDNGPFRTHTGRQYRFVSIEVTGGPRDELSSGSAHAIFIGADPTGRSTPREVLKARKCEVWSDTRLASRWDEVYDICREMLPPWTSFQFVIVQMEPKAIAAILPGEPPVARGPTFDQDYPISVVAPYPENLDSVALGVVLWEGSNINDVLTDVWGYVRFDDPVPLRDVMEDLSHFRRYVYFHRPGGQAFVPSSTR
ncbi:MAG: hypothetical protein KDA20_11570 [Phycisphaerales bacterium]|nr:hypothetical protein [Phycisphaerales bacterium]